jgi:ABC-type dipeptide/oligopeptide/nickel transport system ATPase component
MNNPFLFITPRKNEDNLIGRFDFYEKMKKAVLESLDENAIITLNGDFGIGKSFFVEKAMNELSKMKNLKVYYLDFNLNTLNDLRAIPSEKELGKQIIIIIDKFELLLSLSEPLQEKILNLMSELCKNEITLLITTSNDLLKGIKKIEPQIKKYFKILDVPAVNYEETKKLVISRLNEARKTHSDSITPFTESELHSIYKNTKGNPRLILMLLASIYEEKMSGLK